MPDDPVEIIKADHRKVEELFKEYESLGGFAFVHKRQAADQLILELENHAEMEETYCYPRLKDAFTADDDHLVEEAEAEHEVAKHVIAELKALEPEDPQFDAKIKVLKDAVLHHVKEEEEDLLPRAEKEMDEETLALMASEMREFKATRGAAE